MKKVLICLLMFCIGIISNCLGVMPQIGYISILPTKSIVAIRIALIAILLILLLLVFNEVYISNKYHIHLSKKIILFAYCTVFIIITGTIIFVRNIGVEMTYGYGNILLSTIERVFDFTEW